MYGYVVFCSHFVWTREVGVSSRNVVSRTFPHFSQSMLTPMRVICAMLSTRFHLISIQCEALCKYIETLQKLTKLDMINLQNYCLWKNHWHTKNPQNIFKMIFTKTNGNRYSNLKYQGSGVCNYTKYGSVWHFGVAGSPSKEATPGYLCVESTFTITTTHVPRSCFLGSQANIYRCPSQRRTWRPVRTRTSWGSWCRTFRVDILQKEEARVNNGVRVKEDEMVNEGQGLTRRRGLMRRQGLMRMRWLLKEGARVNEDEMVIKRGGEG